MKIYSLICVILILLSFPAAAASSGQDYEGHGDSLFDDGNICLQAPAKNAVWQTGTMGKIAWTYSSLTGRRVDILLLRGGKPVATIALRFEIDKGEYNWTIPADLEPGDDYRIEVKSVLFPWCYGLSDKFRLVAGSLPADAP